MKNFNGKQNQNKMTDLFRTYQKQRTSGNNVRLNLNERLQTLKKIENINSSPSNSTDNDGQAQSIYKAYQCNRDPYRAELCSLIMNAARDNTKKRCNQNQYTDSTQFHSQRAGDKNQSIIKKIFNWPNTIIAKIIGKFTNFWTVDWRISVPIIVFVLVAAISFIQIDNSIQIQDDYFIALDDFPTVLSEHAANLSEKIRPSIDSTFSFSTGDNLTNNTFQIGVILADLPLLVKANSQQATIGLLARLRQLTEKTGSEILLPSIHALHTTLTGSQTDSRPTREQIDSQALKLLKLATVHYAEHDLGDIFKLGKWIEQTYLATLILHQELDNPLLYQLFTQRKAISHNALQKLQNEPTAITLLEDLENFELQIEPTPGDIRRLQKKLVQIKTILL